MFRKKTKKEQMVEARRKRQNQSEAEQAQRPRHHRKTYAGLFALFFLLSTLVSFLGQSPVSPLLRVNQIANTRIIADFPFEYTSKIQTERRIETQIKRVAPVYKIETAHVDEFESAIQPLLTSLEAWQQEEALKDEPHSADAVTMQALIRPLTGYWNPQDLATLVNKTTPTERKRLFEEAIMTLRDIQRGGVYSAKANDDLFSGQPYLVNLDIQGAPLRASIQSLEDALRYLRINISAMSASDEVSRALFRIVKQGLQPNLVFDRAATQQKIATIEQHTEPVVVTIRKGQPLVEAGARITPEQIEQVQAYQQVMRKRDSYAYGLNLLFFQNALLAAGLILGAALLCNAAMPRLIHSPMRQGLILLVILGNLVLLRLISELADSPLIVSNWKLAEVIAFASPVALATLLLTVMLGVSAGVFACLSVSAYHAIMHGYSMELLTVSLLANAVTIYFCRDIRFRAKVVKAGAMAGTTAALAAIIIGLTEGAPAVLVIQQIIASIFMGFITGILAVGLLPLLENSFKFTTDITLLELTDFNHPLLRRMQLIAPGSYHHSLMVANLAERAAAVVGANSLQCRVCALFHDVGKMVKPEYFTENQREGMNPHIEKNPSMSALVIKSHVKEGVILARQHKLPRQIVEAIEQHHGTGLIWFFFHRARQLHEEQQKQGGSHEPFKIDESTYRYDGPRPQNTENAILLLADSVEAASRSLKKPSATNIEELVDKIINTHLEDGQLDEAPITMRQLRDIRQSLIFTLLNTLHQRTEYPDRPDPAKARSETANPPKPSEPSGESVDAPEEHPEQAI